MTISDIKKNLSRFNAISCREESGSKLIKNITDSDCVTVLDPTLLIDSNIWKPLYKDRIIKEPYIFVYLYPYISPPFSFDFVMINMINIRFCNL